MPQILAKTAAVQAHIPIGTVKLIRESNALARGMRERAQDGGRILPHKKPHFYCWHDAA
jgi:hypothetical protein